MQLIRKITITLETPALEISLAFITMNSYCRQALGGENGGKPKIPLHSWNINVKFSSHLFFFCKWFSCYWSRLPPNKNQNLLARGVLCNTLIKQIYASTTGTGHTFYYNMYRTGSSVHCQGSANKHSGAASITYLDSILHREDKIIQLFQWSASSLPLWY